MRINSISRQNIVRALRVCNPLNMLGSQSWSRSEIRCHHTNYHDKFVFNKSRYERGVIKYVVGSINRDTKHLTRKEQEERLMEELEMDLMASSSPTQADTTLSCNQNMDDKEIQCKGKDVVQHCPSQLFIIPEPNK